MVLAAKSCPTLATPWTVALQAPLSMGFSRQEYWSGLPFPSPTVPDSACFPLFEILFKISHIHGHRKYKFMKVLENEGYELA